MIYQPVVPFSGYSGWTYLQRTQEKQIALVNNSAVNKREDSYFRENIDKVKSAAELVADPKLLKTALTAFGLKDDFKSKAFIRKMLEDGPEDSKALANRLADKRYLAFVKAFDFSQPKAPATQSLGFATKILSKVATERFEAAVGEQSQTMRLALNLQQDLLELAQTSQSDNAKWFTIMGNKPLREVFEKAFSLPSSFASSDLDAQLKALRAKAQSQLGQGEVSQFKDPVQLEKLTKLYVIRADLEAGSGYATKAQSALTLLQSMPSVRR